MNPWDDPNSIWKTKSEYFVWLRGNLRKIWSDYPLRKEWKKNALRPVTKEERKQKRFHPSTKNVGQCVFCKEWFPGSKLEVDHKIPSSCYDYKTAEQFLWHCAAAISDALQLTCPPCHKIKSHQERYGFGTFEEAFIAKQVIEFGKQTLTEQKKQLSSLNLVPTKDTKKACTETYEKYLNEED